MKGVTDCRVSTGLISHPKKLKLQRRLGKQAVWSLIALWSFAASNRPDGSLTGMTAEDIAIAADWDGDADAFVSVLVDLRLIDGEPGQLSIHDWAENNPWAAGSSKRSESAKVAALIKHHGKDGARMLVASEAHAGRTAEEDENTALRMPVASEAHATSVNPQCPVSVSVSISASDSIFHPPTSSEPSAVGEREELPPANAVAPSQAERRIEDQRPLTISAAAGGPKQYATAAAPRGTRLPTAWKLDTQLITEAKRARTEAGLAPLTDVELRAEGAKFRDHWHAAAGAKGVKLDWLATWRNWIRNARPAMPFTGAPPVAASAQMAITADDEDPT